MSANLLGTKVVSIFGVSASVGTFLIPFAFLITDVVGEVHGRELTKRFVYTAMVSLCVVFVAVVVFVKLEPNPRFEYDEAYRSIFGSSGRLIAASIAAFFLSQMNDVYVFSWLRKQTGGRLLWLRNNVSTMLSQAVDTLVFMYLAFYLITPKFDALFVLELAYPYYLLKIAFAFFDTPLVYLGVRWLREDTPAPSEIRPAA